MAIAGISPVAGTLLDADQSVTFTVDDTYTYLRIEVFTAVGVAYAYDSGLGGTQSGYSVAVSNAAGVDTFIVSADAGWDASPLVIQVVEDETGTEATTSITWTLSGMHVFPQSSVPYFGMFAGTFKVTEDDIGGAANVGHIDVTGPVGGVDGISIENLGGGKVRLTANATTNDPDAIHDNVANEISALPEKTVPHDDDLVMIEDFEDSFAKKKVKRKNMGSARNPAKMGTDFSAALLYTFEGVRTNSGSAGAAYDLVNMVGDELYTAVAVPFRKALWTDPTIGCFSADLTPSAEVAAVEDCTIQAMIRFADTIPESGLKDSNIFALAENHDNNDACWSLMGLTAGSTKMEPAFQYTDTDSVVVTVSDSIFVLGDNSLTHMVGRRVLNGATYDCSLWINGIKVAEVTGQKAAKAPTSGYNVFAIRTAADNTGMSRAGIEGLKQSNYALTDEEIATEYRAAIGSPVV